MRPFAKQLRQVLTTYTTRRLPIFLTLLGLAILFSIQIGMLANSSDALRIAKSAMTLTGLPAFALPFLLVLHVKTQFAHPRAVLLPNFRESHLAIPAVILFILMFGLPIEIASWTNCDPLGLPAFACALAVPMIWGIQTNRVVFALMALGIIWSATSENAAQWWAFPNKQLIAVRLLITLAGLSATIAWLWRLSQLREEMDDYEVPVVARSDHPSPAENVTLRKLAAKQFSRSWLLSVSSDMWLAQIRPARHSDRRDRMRLLAYGVSVQPAWISALRMGAIILIMALVMSQFTLFGRSIIQRAAMPVLYCLLFVPSIGVMTPLVQLRPRLSGMLMLPLARADLIDGLLAAIARTVTFNWLALLIVFVIIVVTFPVQQVAPPTGAAFLSLAATISFVGFGLGVRFATWDSVSKRTLALAPAWRQCWEYYSAGGTSGIVSAICQSSSWH